MIYRIITGSLQCNCYLIEAEKELILIDCGGDGEQIVAEAKRIGKPIGAVLLTHGHADHIEGLNRVCEEYGCPVYIHRSDLEFLYNANYNLSKQIYRQPFVFEGSATCFEGGDTLAVCGFEFDVIHTPGHTQGSVCFMSGENLFTGDTLFKDSVGNEFPPFGNFYQELESIRTRLFVLKDDAVCYPGHGEQTNLYYEMRNNQYCRL